MKSACSHFVVGGICVPVFPSHSVHSYEHPCSVGSMQTVDIHWSTFRVVQNRKKPGDVPVARPCPVTEGNAHISHAERFNQPPFGTNDKRIPRQQKDGAASQFLKKLDSSRAWLTATK